MENLPVPLVCITLENVIDDPDTVEGFMQSDPSAVEECIPIIMRRMLGPAASHAGIPPERLTNDMLLRVLQTFWRVAVEQKYSLSMRDIMLLDAANSGASYLVPYLIEQEPTPEQHTLTHTMAIAAGNADLNASREMVSTIQQKTTPSLNDDTLWSTWSGLLNSGAAAGNSYAVELALQKMTHDGETLLTSAGLDMTLATAARDHPERFQTREKEYERIGEVLFKAGVSTYGSRGLEMAGRYGNIGIVRAAIKTRPELLNDPIIAYVFNHALVGGHPEIAQLLVDSGMNLHLSEESPLIAAVSNNNLELVRRILSTPTDIHTKDDKPLKIAFKNDYADIVRELLNHGADPLIFNWKLTSTYMRPNYIPTLRVLREFVEKLPDNADFLWQIDSSIVGASSR